MDKLNNLPKKNNWSIFNKLFFLVLIIKILTALFLTSQKLTANYIPFIEYFLNNPFSNVYDHFLNLSELEVFPYPPLMVYILGILFFIFSPINLVGIGLLDIFLIKMPLLLADIIIYFILCKLLNGHENKVMLFYWMSPIIFYVNYIEGALDIIPIMLVIVSLYFLLNKKNFVASSIFLALSLATKTGIWIIVPFYVVYLWKKKIKLPKIFKFFSITIMLYTLILLPYLFSEGLFKVGILSSSQVNSTNALFKYSDSLVFYIPLAIFGYLLFKALSFRKITKDIMFMLIGLTFILFVTVIIPKASWYVWSIPFMAFLFIKENIDDILYWVFNICYFFYFIVVSNSEFYTIYYILSPNLLILNEFYNLGIKINLYSEVIKGIAFTALVSVLYYISYLILKNIIRRNLIFQQIKGIPTIGIGGDSGSGKTSLAHDLELLFGRNKTIVICGDDVHKWERGDENWNKYTHLNPLSNRIYYNYSQVRSLKFGKNIKRPLYDHETGKFTKPVIISPKDYIISEGLHTFFIQESNSLYNLKVYLCPEENLRKYWKINRDTSKREYSVDKVIEQIKKREPDSSKFIAPQESYADLIIRFVPKSEITLKQSKNKIDLDLVIDLTVDIDSERLLNKINKIAKSLNIQLSYKDHKFQRLLINGKIEKSQLTEITKKVIPDYDEYGINMDELVNDYNGLVQLIIVYCLDFKLKKQFTDGNGGYYDRL